MINLDPSWTLTDDALVLILHAENDTPENVPTGQALTGMRLGQLGGTRTDELWRRETAVLRLISTVEAYTDAASKLFFTKKSLSRPKLPFSWPGRIKYYKEEHAIDLKACDGWGEVEAGIDLRNCLAHGLGNLTEVLLSEKFLGKRMDLIDVSVGGNRMHSTVETVPKLASGCRCLVLDIERELVGRL
jgi:hypothetical protein